MISQNTKRTVRRSTFVSLALWALLALASCVLATEPSPVDIAAEEGFESLFDGRSLTGWRSIPAANLRDWSVRDGVLVGTGSENRQVYLVYRDEQLADFELKLDYRMATIGNSGVEVRARVDQTGKRPLEGYHADFGHVGIGANVLGAWDFHFARRAEHPCPRGTRLVIGADGRTQRTRMEGAVTTDHLNKHGWNRLHIVARGKRLGFSINGHVASEFTDNHPAGFKSGMIGLQLHEAGTRVEFRDIRLKRLVRPEQ